MSFLPRLPDYIRRLQGGARASASTINQISREPRERTVTVAASGTLLPIVYGRAQVPGLLFAQGFIGTDLVVGFIWCIGEIEAVEAIWINDQAVPAGVTVTSYTGTSTQGVNSTLTSAIAGYNDTVRFDTPAGKRGAAYSVLRIPTGQIDAFPRVRATILGRKFPIVGYADIPSYFLADMITDPDYGLNLPVEGLYECVSWNYSLLGNTEVIRNKAGIVIDTGRPIYPQVLDVLAEYAEAFYIMEGDRVRLIPDAPVDLETVPTIDSSRVIKNSISLDPPSTIDVPTEVEFLYTEPTVDGEPWRQESVIASLVGVPTGDVERIPTSVNMEGVWRYEEAYVRAVSRLNRQNGRLSVSWTMTDVGIVYQTGDVIRLNVPYRGVDVPVRIHSVSMSSPGRYVVNGEKYSDSHYSDQIVLPEGIGTIPVGAIVPLAGDTVPTGWAAWTNANGRFIVGSGTTYAVNATGGTTTATGFSGSTSTDPLHPPGAASTFNAIHWSFNGSQNAFGSTFPSADNHSHSLSTSTLTPDLYRRRNKLAIKTGAAGTTVPSECRIFGLDNVSQAVVQKITSFSNRYLMADTVNSGAGSASQTVGLTVGNAGTPHTHVAFYAGMKSDITFPELMCDTDTGISAGAHTHFMSSIALNRNVKRRGLALFGSNSAFQVVPGMIVLFSGGTLPTDWILCNGANGTPDFRDYFIVLAGSTTLAPTGDNTLSITATTPLTTHDHSCGGNETPVYRPLGSLYHGPVAHSHAINLSKAWTPPYYALAVIMFAPGG